MNIPKDPNKANNTERCEIYNILILFDHYEIIMTKPGLVQCVMSLEYIWYVQATCKCNLIRRYHIYTRICRKLLDKFAVQLLVASNDVKKY